jgi:PAS domain S-box-containing protein
VLETARAEAAAAVEAVAAARTDLDTLREQAESYKAAAAEATEAATLARVEAQTGDARIEALREELSTVIGQLQSYKQGFEEARQAAVAARKDAEIARRAVEENGGGIKDPEQLGAIMRELMASAGSGVRSRPGSGVRRRESGIRASASRVGPVPGLAEQAASPSREARPGFDDVDQPLAILDLSGKFRELNGAFCRLVGYQEEQFTKAMWPSVHDRAVYKDQQAELKQLVAGEADSVAVISTYLHGQGLMVLVVGRLELRRDEAGEPQDLILRAEERQPAAH